MTVAGEVFGTEAQRALLTRGAYAYALLRDDPRFSYYGRTVGIATPESGDISLLSALTRLQGGSAYGRVPNADLARHVETAREQGLAITVYTRWEGGATVRDTARAILRNHSLPNDLTAEYIDAEAPSERLAALAEVALACGVLPPAGAVLRGQARPGLGLIARDQEGRAAACAGAAAYVHPDQTLGRAQCWWGMLSTHPDRRGERLALILGAMALIRMQDRYGFTQVFTGVEPGNAASEAVCRRMGLAPADTSVLSVADAALLPSGRMTK
ncbi:hypothetical protein SAMN04488077_103287 [Roseovarius tolerans]|uniref:N-acetyltransferase domain-containing protein n=1 Tax=Roseovarius tolerans TaxID=74031 RepID=A0A1H7X6H6_9RHOB|nr:hypothetical protein [Roseovarius tolerans]SEM29281.1 hypothetical protein SAMN04488077_103287 [Roseovarius tolerans]